MSNQVANQDTLSSSGSSTAASAATIRRITRELQEMQSNPSPHWAIESVEDNLLEWHFTLRGPPGTDFENGLYHGRLLLPFNYPFAPPSIMLLNPNGRFEVNKKICLSMSNYHPELWQPAWGVRTILEALRSFFPTPAEGAIGALEWPAELRRSLARESPEWVCSVCKKRNDEALSPEQSGGAVVVPENVDDSGNGESVTVNKDAPSTVTAPADVTVSASNNASSGEVVKERKTETTRNPNSPVSPSHTLGAQPGTHILNALIIFIVGVIVALVADLVVRPPQ